MIILCQKRSLRIALIVFFLSLLALNPNALMAESLTIEVPGLIRREAPVVQRNQFTAADFLIPNENGENRTEHPQQLQFELDHSINTPDDANRILLSIRKWTLVLHCDGRPLDADYVRSSNIADGKFNGRIAAEYLPRPADDRLPNLREFKLIERRLVYPGAPTVAISLQSQPEQEDEGFTRISLDPETGLFVLRRTNFFQTNKMRFIKVIETGEWGFETEAREVLRECSPGIRTKALFVPFESYTS